MKTVLPTKIASLEEAKAFLRALYDNGESFHPDDDATEIIDSRTHKELFQYEEARAVNILMTQVWEQFDGANDCPSAYILRLDPEYGDYYVRNRLDGMYSCNLHGWSKLEENAIVFSKGDADDFIKAQRNADQLYMEFIPV